MVPVRPPSVPEGARWSNKDEEWAAGPGDEEERRHGLVRFWKADGSARGDCQYEHGKEHGVWRRFHPGGSVAQTCEYAQGVLHGRRVFFASDGPTPEKMLPTAAKTVRRAELDYENGVFVAVRYYDAGGRRVTETGDPFPDRPPKVPENADFRPPANAWVVGAFLDVGLVRSWTKEGRLFAEEHFGRSALNGTKTLYGEDEALLLRQEYVDGRRHGPLEVFGKNGTLRRRALFAEGRLAGPFEEWDEAGRPLPPLEIPPVTPALPGTALLPAEDELLAGLAGGLPAALPRSLTPAAMATAIAIGWGGDDDRDAKVARAARTLVRRLASSELADRLRALFLDRAPRILTATRAAHVAEVLGADAGVDRSRLESEFVERGGEAASLALLREDELAMRFIEATRNPPERIVLERRALREAPRVLGHFTDIQTLELGHNALTTVPRELAGMVRLRKLVLDGNAIRELPPELARLPSLETLHLGNNHLAELPRGMLQLKGLKTINLGYNDLTSLPPGVGELERLEWLWLHDNPLRELPKEIRGWKKIRFLHLGGLPWNEPPPWVFELESLEELWIASGSLKRLSPDVVRLKNLRELCVWYSSLTELPRELFGMTHLREIRISDNPLPEGTRERLAEALPGCTLY